MCFSIKYVLVDNHITIFGRSICTGHQAQWLPGHRAWLGKGRMGAEQMGGFANISGNLKFPETSGKHTLSGKDVLDVWKMSGGGF